MSQKSSFFGELPAPADSFSTRIAIFALPAVSTAKAEHRKRKCR